MRTLGRTGLIVLALLALSLPATSLCEVMGEWMDGCEVAMSQEMSHDMADCRGGASIAAGCCGESGDALANLVLNRSGEEDPLDVAAAFEQPAGPALVPPAALIQPEAAPRGRPPRYQLLSTLLL